MSGQQHLSVNEILFGGQESRRTLNLDKSDILTAQELSKKLVPGNVAFSAIGGSVATGAQKPWSDIDLIVVTNQRPSEIRLQKFCDGYPVQISFFALSDLPGQFARCRHTLAPAMLDVFIDSLYVSGDETKYNQVRELAHNIKNAGPLPISESRMGYMRMQLSTCVLDALKTEKESEKVQWVFRFLDKSMRYLVGLKGQWVDDGEYLVKQFEELYPIPYRQIEQILASQTANGDFHTVAEQLCSVIGAYISLKW